MNKFAKLGSVFGACLLMTGCASIVHGSGEKFAFNSKPSHANVTVDGSKVGRTPTVIDLARKDEHYINIVLPGYQPQSIHLKQTISG